MEDYLYDYSLARLSSTGFEFSDDSISIAKIREVINYARRDLLRLSQEMKNGVSRQRFSAYYTYWFAKLAPISSVFRSDSGFEVVDISERIAIHILNDLMLKGIGTSRTISDVDDFNDDDANNIGFEAPAIPHVWQICQNKCIGECFIKGFRKYLKYHEWQNYEHLVQLLRYGGAGPHELVAVLESTVIASCGTLDL
jgi:hypothetical protein